MSCVSRRWGTLPSGLSNTRCVIDRETNEQEALVEWYWQWKTEVLRGTPVLAPLYSPQFLHRLPRNLTQVCAVSGELISAPPCSVKNVSLLGSRWSIRLSFVCFFVCWSVGSQSELHWNSANRGMLFDKRCRMLWWTESWALLMLKH